MNTFLMLSLVPLTLALYVVPEVFARPPRPDHKRRALVLAVVPAAIGWALFAGLLALRADVIGAALALLLASLFTAVTAVAAQRLWAPKLTGPESVAGRRSAVAVIALTAAIFGCVLLIA